MRIYLLWLLVFLFSVYAWRDWFKALCFLVVLMAFVERPDMPKAISGIPGLNPWNILFLNVSIAAFFNIKSTPLDFKTKGIIKALISYYLILIVFSFFRGVFDQSGIIEFTDLYGGEPLSSLGLLIEDVINPIKYVVPGVLIYYGANNEQRIRLAIYTVLFMHLLISLQVIKSMPLGYLTDGTALEQRAIRVIDRDIGYFRSDLSIILAGSAWTIYALRYAVESKLFKMFCLGSFLVIGLAIALTGGRAGQGVFLVIGLVFGLYRWRHLFALAPVGLIALVIMIPSVYDRFTQGFSYDPDDTHFQQSESVEEGRFNSVTSGRTVIWPHVLDKIGDSPIIGYGRRAMMRIGLSKWLADNLGEGFPHPHNAYLQLFLDNGILFSIPILWFYLYVLRRAFTLFKDQDSKIRMLVGAFGIGSILSFLIGGIAQQSFYPPASSVAMFCAIGLVLRLSMQKTQEVTAVSKKESSSPRNFYTSITANTETAGSERKNIYF